MVIGAELESSRSEAAIRASALRSRFMHRQKLMVRGAAREVAFSVIGEGGERQAVYDLVNDRYGWRGYGSAHTIPSDAYHITFLAEVDQTVVGTITLAIDSPFGLTVDRTFADEIDRARGEVGAQVCELTKLAFDPSVRSKEVLARLFHIVFIYGTSTSECTHLFIEVNPRHVAFYETMLGFERVGSMKVNASVGAPSQLMMLKVDAICRSIRELAGSTETASGHSLYPFFFPTWEEELIRRSLAFSQIGSDRKPDLFDPQPGRGELSAAQGVRQAA
jgi:hypothetical protein